MLLLIFTIVVCLGIAFFASQNTSSVNVVLGGYFLPNVPLYLIVLGAMLFGIFVSWVISLFDNLTSFFAIRGRENRIRRSEGEVERLEARIQDLETENARLIGENRIPTFSTHREHTHVDKPYRESFLGRLRNRMRSRT